MAEVAGDPLVMALDLVADGDRGGTLGERGDEDRGCEAVNEAQPRQSHRELVARKRRQRLRIARSPHNRAEARQDRGRAGDVGHPILRWGNCDAGYGIT